MARSAEVSAWRVYDPILRTLATRTHLPILLPADLRGLDSPLHAEIGSVTATTYVVNVDLAPGCRFADACGSLQVSAIALASSTKLFGRIVRLRDGTTAYYHPLTCGASCGSSSLAWKTKAAQYVIAIKGGLLKDLLRAANSMHAY